MQCKNCGRDVKSDFKYCPYCANRLINDFEDHYGELNPPYVMPDLTSPEPDDDAAFLYGRSRVIPDEADAFFAPEQPAAPTENTDRAGSAPAHESRPLPYEVYRPEPVSGAAPYHLPDDLPDLPEEDFAPEFEPYTPLCETFRANLPDELPDDLSDLPDLPDLPEEDFAPEPERDIPSPAAAADVPFAPEELEWEPQLAGAAPEDRHSKTSSLEDAPYVSMQPDLDAQEQAGHARPKAQQSPGMAIKLLLILFMILLGVLASFVLYRFWGKLNIADWLKFVPSAPASCWK